MLRINASARKPPLPTVGAPESSSSSQATARPVKAEAGATRKRRARTPTVAQRLKEERDAYNPVEHARDFDKHVEEATADNTNNRLTLDTCDRECRELLSQVVDIERKVDPNSDLGKEISNISVRLRRHGLTVAALKRDNLTQRERLRHLGTSKLMQDSSAFEYLLAARYSDPEYGDPTTGLLPAMTR